MASISSNTIEPNIQQIVYKYNTTFKVTVHCNKQLYRKTFSTINEARNYRNSIISNVDTKASSKKDVCPLCLKKSVLLHNPKTEFTQKVISAVKDYTNKSLCRNCNKGITINYTNNNISIDDSIIKRLYSNYAVKVHGAVEANRVHMLIKRKFNREYKTNSSKKYFKNEKLSSYLTIEPFIYEVTYRSGTKKIIFKTRREYKSFNTLEEAQQYKKDITCQQQMI